MKKNALNAGFSLIELVIAMSILITLSSMVFIGIRVYRKKETDIFASRLCNQIRLMQATAMTNAGKWRLSLYVEEGKYYCVQEQARTGENGSLTWEKASEQVMLGHVGAVTYKGISTNGRQSEVDSEAEMEGDALIRVWRFDGDTGSCTEGSGTLRLYGPGKTFDISVFRENGRVEAAAVR